METPSRFKVLEHLGRGGTAQVVRVSAADLTAGAALKMPSDGGDVDEFQRLARREFDLLGTRRSPFVVSILEPPITDPPGLLLELCSGPTLDRKLPVSDLTTALNTISALALALEYVHASGIVHGDLKPHNVFLPPGFETTPSSDRFFLKLADFSLGKQVTEPDSSRLGLGTVGYMAPETIRDKSSTLLSDMFALGTIAYQVLTGEHPFLQDDPDPARTNSRATEEDPSPLNRLRDDVPPEVAVLVADLIAKDPAERPGSPWQVCEALAEVGASYPHRRLWRPTWLLRNDETYDQTVTYRLDLSDRQRSRLNVLTGESCRQLRLLLAVNHRRGNLRYSDRRFSFVGEIYWPVAMRRRLLREFATYPLTEKRIAVKCALTGSGDAASQAGIAADSALGICQPALLELLPHLLRAPTVRRLSRGLAPLLERSEQFERAATAYLQAGHLPDAERCALQAVIALQSDHRYDEALRLISQVVRFADTSRRRFDTRELLMLRGDIYKEQGELVPAQQSYDEIIALYDGHQPDKLLAETFKDLGDLYKMKQDYAGGLKVLEQALSIYRDLGDTLEISHTLNNMGNIYWLKSDMRQALACFRACLRVQRRMKAEADVASTLNNIGTIYAGQGRLQRAMNIFEQSLTISRRLGRSVDIARTLNNLGCVMIEGGLNPKAVDYLSESLDINRRIGSKKEILHNLENLSLVLVLSGRLEQAVGTLDDGIRLSREIGDRRHRCAFYTSLAAIHTHTGQYDEAAKALDRVRDMLEDIDDRVAVVQHEIECAALRLAVNDAAGCGTFARSALHRAESTKDPMLQLSALLYLIRADGDEETVSRTKALAEQLSLTREGLLVELNHLEALLDQERVDQARTLAVQITPRVTQLEEDIELPRIFNLLAEVALLTDDIETAQGHVTRAYRLAKKCGLNPQMALSLTRQGHIHVSTKDYEEAFSAYRQALRMYKEIASHMTSEEDRQTFQSHRSVVFLTREIRRLAEHLQNKERVDQ